MSYVEWLRVRNCLIGVGGTMVVLIVFTLILRVVFASQIGSNDAFVNKISTSPGTKITHSTLPNGTPRTTIVSPSDDTTITIDGGGSIERHMVIDEPASRHSGHDLDNFKLASVSVRSVLQGDREITTVDTNAPTAIAFYLMFGTIVSFIVATCLGFPFAKENDGHLEIAAMRPQGRLLLALRTVGVDLAGILLASMVTVVALVICQAMFEIPRFTFTQGSGQILAMSIAGPFAWYAMLAAATSSLKRGYGAVIGFAWPAAIVVVVFGMITWGDSVLGQLMHSVFGTIMWIDPLRYATMATHVDSATGEALLKGDVWFNFGMESILFVIYSALAVFQWQRVEA